MQDIFIDIQEKVGCPYIFDLFCHKRKIWHEMKRPNLADYGGKHLEDFSKYIFDIPYKIFYVENVWLSNHVI